MDPPLEAGRFGGPRRQSVGDADAVRLPEGTARQRFGTRRVARLATVDASGRPHIVVTTFALSGTTVYLVVDEKPKTTRDLKRLRNIRVNPAVSLLADHYDEDWMNLWWVRADGHAVIVDHPRVTAEAIELLAGRYPQYRASRPRGPVIAVTVDTWTGWASDQ
jgi:PPOX class probable F420-dependent enzyme